MIGNFSHRCNLQEAKMDYIKIRFGKESDRLESSFEKTIQDLFRAANPIYMYSERKWNPQMDIYETPEEIIVLAEIAGVEKDDFEVEINSRAIRIHGHRKEMPRIDGSTYRLAEIQYGRFERTLFLPSPIDPEVVSASYINGFLKIRSVKLKLDQTHTIPISEE
jgi:HSP20 family protein